MIIEELKRQGLNYKDFGKWLKEYEDVMTYFIHKVAANKAGSPYVEECVSKSQAYLAGAETFLEVINAFEEEATVEDAKEELA